MGVPDSAVEEKLMDNYIFREGDVLGRHDGRPPIEMRKISGTHVTFVVRGDGKEQTVTRSRFRYWLWYGYFFLLERAS